MIADKLAALGIPPRVVVGIIVLALAFLSAMASIVFGDPRIVAAVTAFLAGVSVLIDPYAGHSQAVG